MPREQIRGYTCWIDFDKEVDESEFNRALGELLWKWNASHYDSQGYTEEEREAAFEAWNKREE